MPGITRLSAYRNMWIFTFFDLPTETKKQRKAYTEFRKGLINLGFNMLQFSVYIRHCASKEAIDSQVRRIERILPKHGKISVMEVTDKQFERIHHYWGCEQVDPPETPQQLQMF